jgi:hypothetical protein
VSAATTSPVTTAKIVSAPTAELVSDLTSETPTPKPYDIIQGMECIINMMEETLARELNADTVAPQDLPLRPAITQRRLCSSGGQVPPDPIWVAAAIWRRQARAPRTPRSARRTVHLP